MGLNSGAAQYKVARLVNEAVLPERRRFLQVGNRFVYPEPLSTARGPVLGLNFIEQYLLLEEVGRACSMKLDTGRFADNIATEQLPAYRERVLGQHEGVLTSLTSNGPTVAVSVTGVALSRNAKGYDIYGRHIPHDWPTRSGRFSRSVGPPSDSDLTQSGRYSWEHKQPSLGGYMAVHARWDSQRGVLVFDLQDVIVDAQFTVPMWTDSLPQRDTERVPARRAAPARSRVEEPVGKEPAEEVQRVRREVPVAP